MSHVLVAHALGRLRLGWLELGWFVSGTLLPDLFTGVGVRVWVRLHGWQALALEPEAARVYEGLRALQTPAGVAVASGVLALLLPTVLLRPLSRARVWGLLATGGWLHVALDLLQRHDRPLHAPFFPLSAATWELGWVDPSASLAWWPWLLVLCAALERRARLSGP